MGSGGSGTGGGGVPRIRPPCWMSRVRARLRGLLQSCTHSAAGEWVCVFVVPEPSDKAVEGRASPRLCGAARRAAAPRPRDGGRTGRADASGRGCGCPVAHTLGADALAEVTRTPPPGYCHHPARPSQAPSGRP